MNRSTIDQLIIKFPIKNERHYWSYDRETRLLTLNDGRCPAGYIVASERSKVFDNICNWHILQ